MTRKRYITPKEWLTCLREVNQTPSEETEGDKPVLQNLMTTFLTMLETLDAPTTIPMSFNLSPYMITEHSLVPALEL